MPWWYLATLVAANLALLLPNASPLRVAGALLLLGFLPGFSWATPILTATNPLFRWTAAAALSFVLTILAALLIHYLPGPIQTWPLLVILNLFALLPVVLRKIRPAVSSAAFSGVRSLAPLLFILLIALLLRTANLDYSEFQGDEALAMIVAAEALEGHEEALLLRSKGPAEVLLPLALWRLTGTITEAIARLPFTIAALLSVVTLYLIGTELGGDRVGWLAAGFFAFNGFMVGFGRIVQYQALVVWLSALAFLMLLTWRRTGHLRYPFLSGLCLGTGLLAHYDAILVAPALGWLLLTPPPRTGSSQQEKPANRPFIYSLFVHSPFAASLRHSLKPTLLLVTALLLTSLPFYLPFFLNPQAGRTGAYVGERIGNELRNNLPDFFHFNIFYSSSYYIILTGLLVLGLLTWFIRQAHPKLRWLSLLTGLAVIAVILQPNLLANEKLDLSILPFALLFGTTFFTLPFLPPSKFPRPPSPPLPSLQALTIWLAVPFLGYNFVVALGLTHIYTIVPAWSLLTALSWHYLFDLSRFRSRRPSAFILRHLPGLLLLGPALLSTLFLWNAFVRHDVEYLQDYPAGQLRLFWTPYDQPPQTGFFGFAHRAGWKAIGQKIVTGELKGDYGSNEEPDVTTWYTRSAPRACDPQPEFYFLADDLVDPTKIPTELIAAGYDEIGQVVLANQKQMQIMQQRPVTLDLGTLNEATLAKKFDASAVPAAFARSVRGTIPVEVNFSSLVRLISYDVDTRRAYPGGRIPVTLYWQALAPIPTSYQIFAHLESASGPVAQADGEPVCWRYPTNLWRPGQIIADQHAIAIPVDITPGTYPLEVGLYLPDTFQRLDRLDQAGNPAGTSITLTEVTIDNEQ